jgi:hypothetical protein
VLFVATLFSFRHQGTKALRKNNRIKSLVPLCLCGKNFMVPACPGWVLMTRSGFMFYYKNGEKKNAR